MQIPHQARAGRLPCGGGRRWPRGIGHLGKIGATAAGWPTIAEICKAARPWRQPVDHAGKPCGEIPIIAGRSLRQQAATGWPAEPRREAQARRCIGPKTAARASASDIASKSLGAADKIGPSKSASRLVKNSIARIARDRRGPASLARSAPARGHRGPPFPNQLAGWLQPSLADFQQLPQAEETAHSAAVQTI